MTSVMRDEFLSDEDLDLRTLSREELLAYWDEWLLQAQATNAHDRRAYSHGVFVTMEEPEAGAGRLRVAEPSAACVSGHPDSTNRG